MIGTLRPKVKVFDANSNTMHVTRSCSERSLELSLELVEAYYSDKDSLTLPLYTFALSIDHQLRST